MVVLVALEALVVLAVLVTLAQTIHNLFHSHLVVFYDPVYIHEFYHQDNYIRSFYSTPSNYQKMSLNFSEAGSPSIPQCDLGIS